MAGMALTFALTLALGLSFAWTVAVLAAYFAIVFAYELYAMHFNRRERTARRRARRSETGLYGWPITDVQAQTVSFMPRASASLEPSAPRIAPAVATPAPDEPRLEPVAEEPEVEDWPVSAPVVEEEPEAAPVAEAEPEPQPEPE